MEWNKQYGKESNNTARKQTIRQWSEQYGNQTNDTAMEQTIRLYTDRLRVWIEIMLQMKNAACWIWE